VTSNSRTRRATAVALVLFLSLAVVPQASATFPVFDYVNWILSWIQRAQQIQHQYDQLVALKKQLESYGEGGDFNSLNGILGDLDQLFRDGENLGYLLIGVEQVFEETFPGYEAPIAWPEEFQTRIYRTQNTLRLITASLNRLTAANTRSQVMVDRLTALSRRADSPLEELEVQSMLETLAVTEQQRILQGQLLTANAVTIAAAAEVQRVAAAEAARSGWIASESAPEPGYDPHPEGFTGVPRDWPWSL
jgi:hypothetical protein